MRFRDDGLPGRSGPALPRRRGLLAGGDPLRRLPRGALPRRRPLPGGRGLPCRRPLPRRRGLLRRGDPLRRLPRGALCAPSCPRVVAAFLAVRFRVAAAFLAAIRFGDFRVGLARRRPLPGGRGLPRGPLPSPRPSSRRRSASATSAWPSSARRALPRRRGLLAGRHALRRPPGRDRAAPAPSTPARTWCSASSRVATAHHRAGRSATAGHHRRLHPGRRAIPRRRLRLPGGLGSARRVERGRLLLLPLLRCVGTALALFPGPVPRAAFRWRHA